MTFTAPEGKEIVSKLSINYENVDITDEIVNGTYTGTFTSSIIVSAEFGSVQDYGESLFEEYYKNLCKNDKDLALVAKNNNSYVKSAQSGCSSFYTEELADLYISGQYSIQKTATTADKSAKERVALLRTELEKQEKVIDEAYTKLISDAKENAINGLESLYKSGHNSENDDLSLGGRKDMTDADRSAMLSTGKAQVEACTTLNAIGKLVAEDLTNVNYLNDSSSSYAILEQNRAAVFAAIDDALEDVYEIDNEFDPEDENNKTLISMLKDTYGIQESELPDTIAETYRQKASSAKSFAAVSSTDSTLALAKEASEAIMGAYDSIMDKVEAAVIAVYDVDIKAYSNDQDWITSTHACVVNLVQNWVKSTRDGNDKASFSDEKLGNVYFNKLSVSNLVSYKGDGTISSPYGGVAYIEAYLAKWNIPFTEYRLKKEKDSVIASVTAYGANIVSNDAKYNSFLTKSGTNSIKDTTISVIGVSTTHYKSSTIHKYNITEFVKEIQVPSNISTVTEIRALLQEYKWAVDYIYAYAKIEYINNYDTLNGTSGNYGRYSTIATEVTTAKGYSIDTNGTTTLGNDIKLFIDEYQSKVANVNANVTDDDVNYIKAQNFNEIDSYVSNFKTHLQLIKALDDGYNNFIDTIEDMDFSDLVYKTDINNEKTGIFNNTVSSSDVQTFINNLRASYNDKVAQYKVDAKARLTKIYEDQYVRGGSSEFNLQNLPALQSVYESLLNQCGTTFSCNSYHSINNWLKFAENKLYEFAQDGLSAVPTELEGNDTDKTKVSAVSGDSISEKLNISVTKNLSVADASAYDAVYDIKVSSLEGYTSGAVYDSYSSSDQVNDKIYAVYFNIGEALSDEKSYLSINGDIKYSQNLGNLSSTDGKLSILFKEAGKKTVIVEWSKGMEGDPVHRVKLNIEVSSLAS